MSRKRILDSVQDALELIGEPCTSCEEVGWPYRFDRFTKEGDALLYTCESSFHETKFRIDPSFSFSEQTLLDVAQQYREFYASRDFSALTSLQFKDFEREKALFISKLVSLGSLLDEGQNVTFEGSCNYCGGTVPIEVKKVNNKAKMWFTDPPCASIVADSAY